MQSALDSPFFSSSHLFLLYHSCWPLQSYGYSVDIKPWTLFHFHHILLPSFLSCSATSSIFHPHHLFLFTELAVMSIPTAGVLGSQRLVDMWNPLSSISLSSFTHSLPLSHLYHAISIYRADTNTSSLGPSPPFSLLHKISLFVSTETRCSNLAISLAGYISNCLCITTFTSQFLFFHMV